MKPAPLDEFPVHQTPLSMAQVSTSDRNFYDRNYFNAPDRSGDADGRVEQLGWPRMEVDYRAGTRHPEHVRLHLTTPRGEPLLLEIDTLLGIPLSMGSGYVGDPAWPHGH